MSKVDQHANPTREDPLTPDETRAPTHAERARTMVSVSRRSESEGKLNAGTSGGVIQQPAPSTTAMANPGLHGERMD